MHTQIITTNSLEETLSFAEIIGTKCVGGEVFELISDLGGGKTAFTRGLVAGLGSIDEVNSPSFTINNTYKTDKLIIEHFDFYRLNESGVVGEELKEALSASNTVVIVEWGNIVQEVLGQNDIKVEIQATGEDSRKFIFSFPDKFSYLFGGLS